MVIKMGRKKQQPVKDQKEIDKEKYVRRKAKREAEGYKPNTRGRPRKIQDEGTETSEF
jgi:hypothetical protein